MAERGIDLDTLRRTATRLLVGFMWLQPPIIAAAALALDVPVLASLATALVVAGCAQAAILLDKDSTISRIALGVALMAHISILVAVFNGQAMQVDMHMYYFAALALLVAMCDWKVIAAAAFSVAVHHIALNYLLPNLIYPGGSNFFRLALHAVILLVEAGALMWLAMTVQGMFDAIVAAGERAEESLRAAEASRQDAEAAKARAEEAHRLYEENQQRSAEERSHAEGEQRRVLAEVTETVKRNAEIAVRADKVAAETFVVAEKGGQVASQAVEAMSRIQDASGKISDIIAVIDEIARQTNLLALNAAVEAARAGEAGRGFAVVATEVRDLAQRSSGAAKDIKELITNSSAQVETGVSLVNSAGASLTEIVKSIEQVTGIVSEIASASGSQAESLDQLISVDSSGRLDRRAA